ncbi:FHA domain-containing protein [Trebonia kvetii]|uniref:FHA domain-containing protein n=1 Tax=Trebonia kvetii TaxID=2480626 RepID=A0A6P2BNU6_9ACTN|nr:DUF1707 and FHA domain-containing protein [Trebonia kvetii]TVZ00652.1 FHA domain-containing protein [Trebonia kvetii]
MGGSAAQTPTSPDEQPAAGLRASDADRDQVVSRLRDEYVAGRLSQETFLHRMNLVLETKRQVDLPPLLADLPQPTPNGQKVGQTLGGWLRGTWSRVTATQIRRPGRDAPPRTVAPRRAPLRAMTTGMGAADVGRRVPLALQFPRGSGDQFSIGRDASCDLAIADVTVSRRHAQLERTADGWLLSDLESTNGTRINGWRVRGRVPVRVGDLVSFGSLEAVFARGDD